MGPLDFLIGGGNSAAALGNPLIKALLAKHGASMPEAPPVDGPPKIGPDVGSQLASPEERNSNVFDNLDMGAGVPGAGGMDAIKASLAANAAKPRGFLDRIGDFLHSDEGRATAMRFAAGAFKGGMGGGLEAATNFADQRRHEQAATASANADRDERGREFDENHQFHLGQLDETREQNRETAEHYRRGDMNDSRRIDADLYKHDTPSGDARTQSQTSIYTHLNPSGDTVANTNERRFEHITPSGDTAMTQTNENSRNDANNRTSLQVANIGHPPDKGSVHIRYQATPDTLGAQHEAAVAAIRGSQQQSQPGDDNAAVHHVANDDQYNALPPGSRFMGPDGKVRVKP